MLISPSCSRSLRTLFSEGRCTPSIAARVRWGSATRASSASSASSRAAWAVSDPPSRPEHPGLAGGQPLRHARQPAAGDRQPGRQELLEFTAAQVQAAGVGQRAPGIRHRHGEQQRDVAVHVVGPQHGNHGAAETRADRQLDAALADDPHPRRSIAGPERELPRGELADIQHAVSAATSSAPAAPPLRGRRSGHPRGLPDPRLLLGPVRGQQPGDRPRTGNPRHAHATIVSPR